MNIYIAFPPFLIFIFSIESFGISYNRNHMTFPCSQQWCFLVFRHFRNTCIFDVEGEGHPYMLISFFLATLVYVVMLYRLTHIAAMLHQVCRLLLIIMIRCKLNKRGFKNLQRLHVNLANSSCHKYHLVPSFKLTILFNIIFPSSLSLSKVK